jgi:hypothetical protein
MIPPHLRHELIDLLAPLAQTAPERLILLRGAFGADHPILNQLKWTETTEHFLTDALNKLDEYGEVAPGKRAVWALLESLLEPGKVDANTQKRIRALEQALNAPTPVPKLLGAGLRVFISYARADGEPFARRLRDDLTGQGFKVWWDRASTAKRGLTLQQAIQQTINEVERVILVFGPGVGQSAYVRAEWEFALSLCKPVLTLLRGGDYDLLPAALKPRDVLDFRDDAQYQAKFADLVRQLGEPAAPPGKLVKVPALPPQFQARRKEVQAIKDELLVDANQPLAVTAPSRCAALQGVGGIGKTVLAIAIARDCAVRRSFPDGVLWVTLGQVPNLMPRQGDLCRALGDPPQTFADVQQGKTRLSDLLQEKACLLVIDDVWELEHARAFEATGPRGALLITTRDESLVDDLGASRHQVDVFGEEEALTLMARWLMTGDDTLAYDEPEQMAQLERLKAAMPPEAKAVAQECGYLPLALTLSAAQIRDGLAWGTLLTDGETH